MSCSPGRATGGPCPTSTGCEAWDLETLLYEGGRVRDGTAAHSTPPPAATAAAALAADAPVEITTPEKLARAAGPVGTGRRVGCATHQHRHDGQSEAGAGSSAATKAGTDVAQNSTHKRGWLSQDLTLEYEPQTHAASLSQGLTMEYEPQHHAASLAQSLTMEYEPRPCAASLSQSLTMEYEPRPRAPSPSQSLTMEYEPHPGLTQGTRSAETADSEDQQSPWIVSIKRRKVEEATAVAARIRQSRERATMGAAKQRYLNPHSVSFYDAIGGKRSTQRRFPQPQLQQQEQHSGQRQLTITESLKPRESFHEIIIV